MWNTIRRSLIPGLVVVVGSYGAAFATTGSLNPLNLVASTHANPAATASHSPNSHAAKGLAHKADKTPKPERTPKPSHGPERSTVGCPEGFTGNHGQFVSQSEDKQAAAESECGKPVQAVHSPDASAGATEPGDDNGKAVHEQENEPETEPSESPEAEHTGGGSDNGAEHSQGHGNN